MERPDSQIYQLPDSTDNDVRQMIVGLAWFFGVLCTLVILFVIYAPTILRLVPFSIEKNFVKPYEELAGYIWKEWDGKTYPEIDHYLQQLSDGLSQSMNLPDGMEIQVHYIQSEQVNAFATLGGHIFITSGLLEAVPDENSLAMVVAHELAHQLHRDPITGLSRGIALQLIIALISGDIRQIDLTGISAELSLLYFSRDQEQRADKTAIDTLNKYYGHVSGYDQFFRAILDHSEHVDEVPSWLSSHPNTADRIEYLDNLVYEKDWLVLDALPIPEEITEQLSTIKE